MPYTPQSPVAAKVKRTVDVQMTTFQVTALGVLISETGPQLQIAHTGGTMVDGKVSPLMDPVAHTVTPETLSALLEASPELYGLIKQFAYDALIMDKVLPEGGATS